MPFVTLQYILFNLAISRNFGVSVAFIFEIVVICPLDAN